ncbi:MAG: hypothetical protein ACYDBZ_00325 [Steroidobacteraceae bacterium]
MSVNKRRDPEPARQPDNKRGFFYRALRRAENHADRVRFKDRGSEELEWRGKSETFGEPDTHRLKILQNPALAIVEDAPADDGRIRSNPSGVKKGYDPYDSGKLSKAMAARRRDLRRLGGWLMLRGKSQQEK